MRKVIISFPIAIISLLVIVFSFISCNKEKEETPPPLTVSTAPVTSIEQTTANCGGNVTSANNFLVTSRGVCWSRISNPTISNLHTLDGTGTGSFSSNITGLTPNTPYYVRAFATCSNDTAYGNQVSFSTTGSSTGNPCPGVPFVNYGGQVYSTVQIGTQCWFKENLNIGTQIISGHYSPNQMNNGIIEKYCYENKQSNCNTYGGLYQWDEAMQYTITEGAQGICPSGWHLPSDSEWCTLTQYIDSTVNCNVSGYSGIDVGRKMKSRTGWNIGESGVSGNDNSGFSAIPGGFSNNAGLYWDDGYYANFLSSSENSSKDAWYRSLYCYSAKVKRMSWNKVLGVSVRCIKD